MFEKMLESIAREPSPQKIRAFLSLVETLPSPEMKANVLADFADSRVSQDVVEALKALQCGFRMDPKNGPILKVAESVFKRLNRHEAAKRIAEYRSHTASERLEFGGLSEKTLEFLPGNKTTIAGVAELLTPVSVEKKQVEDAPFQDFEAAFASNEESVSLAFGPSFDKESTHSIRVGPDFSVVQKAPVAPLERKSESTLEAPEASEVSYEIFTRFLQAAELDFRFLDLAEGFSDNTLGLVHFVNFLRDEKKIEGPVLERAVATLKAIVLKPGGDLRCRVRFFDLFDAQNGKN